MKWFVVIMLCVVVGCYPRPKVNYLIGADVKLSPPILDPTKVFFYENTKIKYKNLGDEIAVRYTTDGQMPSNDSPLFTDDLIIEETSSFMFRNFQRGMITSEASIIKVFKMKNIDAKIIDASLASEPYTGSHSVLVDQEKGDGNFRSGKWLGYNSGVVSFTLDIYQHKEIGKVVISALQDQGAWIFAPHEVQVSYFRVDGKTKLVSHRVEAADIESPSGMKFIEIPGVDEAVDKIKITVRPLESIPDWHAGKGTPPWLFLDEIIII